MYKFDASAVYADRADVFFFAWNCSLKKKIAFSLHEKTKGLHKWTLLCDYFYYILYMWLLWLQTIYIIFNNQIITKMLWLPVKRKVLTLAFHLIGMFWNAEHKFWTGRAMSSTRPWLARDSFIHMDEFSPHMFGTIIKADMTVFFMNISHWIVFPRVQMNSYKSLSCVYKI